MGQFDMDESGPGQARRCHVRPKVPFEPRWFDGIIEAYSKRTAWKLTNLVSLKATIDSPLHLGLLRKLNLLGQSFSGA